MQSASQFLKLEKNSSQKLEPMLYFNDLWHFFLENMSIFTNTQVYFFDL
jgi:hypothetical protein